MRIVVFDYETAGVRSTDENIQLAAIAIDEEYSEIETFERKIIFDEAKADPYALKLNHWSKEVWEKEAIPEKQVTFEFYDFLKKHSDVTAYNGEGKPYKVAKLAGYNCHSFDFPRLKNMFERHGKYLPANHLTLDIFHKVQWYCYEKNISLKSYKLTAVAKHFEIPVDNAHEALSDVRLTIKILKHLTSYG